MTLKVSITQPLAHFDLDVSFEAEGGITALFGHSGAGKTTIVNAVAGLFKPQGGRIELNGTPLFDAHARVFVPPAARRLGYVFQDARLFPHLDVEANLTFGTRYAPSNAPGARLDDVVRLLGLQNLLQRTPGTLSGGEKQRVAIGRALLCRPQMLLMDEPLAGLDGPRKQEVLPYLERLRDGPLGLPILYVSHALDEIARLADTLVLLKDGRVERAGPVFDVLADPATTPLLGVRDAGAVLQATATAHTEDGLTRFSISAGELLLPGTAVPIGTMVRLRVLAQDVTLALTRPSGVSALNILPVQVTAVHRGTGPGAVVAVTAGQDRLLARVTERAVKNLGLAPGLSCFAMLKATSVAPGSIGR